LNNTSGYSKTNPFAACGCPYSTIGQTEENTWNSSKKLSKVTEKYN
jgi:hypothetical protein